MNKKKKILLITEFSSNPSQPKTGGVEARTDQIAKSLKEMGYPVTIIASQSPVVTATSLSLWPRLKFQVEAVYRGLKGTYDIVEGSNFVCYLPAFLVARFKQAKAVAWFADVYQLTWFKTMSWPVALAGYVIEWISLHLPWDRVIAMSQSTKEKLIKAGVKPDKIKVVYGGVDCQIIDKIIVNKFDKPTICTAARLVKYKHIDDLIYAVGLAQKKVANLELLIMGDGPERNNLEKLSKHITTHNSVHFLGSLPQQEVWKVMKQASVFCLPSTVEGFGLVTIEAMACGLPYVCADIPATREITHDGRGGYLYKPRDINQLALYLLRALAVKSVKNHFDFVKDYGWDNIAKKTVAAYT